MPDAPALARDERAMLALLQRVSRSFYLSVRLLPAGLRRPVAVGYLLARTSDSLADAPQLAATDRLALLAQFVDDVQGRCPASPIPPARGLGEGERELLACFPDCVAWLHELDVPDRADVLEVLRHIVGGQRLDVERFGDASAQAPRALASARELDAYTYAVAGCVGEFWTRLGFRHVARFASRPQAEMEALGRAYGQALQLVNVLRDAGEDLAQGRCYLPADELAAAGIAPSQLAANPEAFVAVGAPWRARAHAGLQDGLRYALALGAARIRIASALPALIGVRTLARLEAAGPRALAHRVKVPRSQVRGLLLRTLCSLGSRARIEREFGGMGQSPR